VQSLTNPITYQIVTRKIYSYRFYLALKGSKQLKSSQEVAVIAKHGPARSPPDVPVFASSNSPAIIPNLCCMITPHETFSIGLVRRTRSYGRQIRGIVSVYLMNLHAGRLIYAFQVYCTSSRFPPIRTHSSSLPDLPEAHQHFSN
jgi:hypothetical protein